MIPSDCKYVVKKDKVVVKLTKRKGEYSYETVIPGEIRWYGLTRWQWTNLTSKKSKEAADLSKKDPTAGLMDMMKVLCDNSQPKFYQLTNLELLFRTSMTTATRTWRRSSERRWWKLNAVRNLRPPPSTISEKSTSQWCSKGSRRRLLNTLGRMLCSGD